MSLKAKILREKQINKKEKQVTTQFHRRNNKTMNVDDVNDLIDQMYAKGTQAHDDFKCILIRVLNGDKWVTFKDFDDLEDYYSGKVKDTSKFYEFIQVQITCVFS
jgi:hypothetical protein